MTKESVNTPDDPTQLVTPVDILCSYHYFKDIDMARVHSWGTRIVGDSGAYSAHSQGGVIDREELHAWAHRWNKHLFWVAALDVIGDADASYRNWLAARKDGLELVPTVHYLQGTQQLDRFAEQGATLIGLGGTTGISRQEQLRWQLQMYRHVRDHHPHVRFHGWGVTSSLIVDNLPWWSVDSSGFSSAFRYGTLRLWNPKTAKFVTVKLNGRDLAEYAVLIRRYYNLDWKTVSTSHAGNRRLIGRLALRSLQYYAAWLQRRQHVSPPKLLLDRWGPNLGAAPVVTMAMGSGDRSVLTDGNGWPKTDDGSLGPLVVAAMVPSAQGQAITPDGLSIGQQRGPRITAAMGSSYAQVTRSISPTDEYPPRSVPERDGR